MTHWESVEADFQRFYGLDLRTVGCRRIRAFLRALPPSSATARAVDPAAAMWSPEVEWTARSIEYAHGFTVSIVDALYKVMTGKGVKQPEQLRIPRPWDEAPRKGIARRAFMKLLGKNTTVIEGGGES